MLKKASQAHAGQAEDLEKSMKEAVKFDAGKMAALAKKDNNVVECSAFKDLKIVDLTGAGDLFAGGFLDHFIKGKSLKESLNKGTEMSSKIIQTIGARIS